MNRSHIPQCTIWDRHISVTKWSFVGKTQQTSTLYISLKHAVTFINCSIDLIIGVLVMHSSLIELGHHWPLIIYVKLRVAHAPGMPGTFSPPPPISDPDMHHGTRVKHVPWYMPGSLTNGLLWSRWRRKCSRHSGACATRNFGYLVRGPLIRLCKCLSQSIVGANQMSIKIQKISFNNEYKNALCKMV